MSYCNTTDSQAAINLTKNGKAFQVIINSNLPITIGCKNNGFDNGVRVIVTYSWNRCTDGFSLYPRSTAGVILIAPIGGIRGQKESTEYFASRTFKSHPKQIAINTQGNWLVVQDLFGNTGFFVNISIDSIVPVDNVTPTPKGVIIKDKNGSIVYDDNTIDCTWDVICGGGCPEGFCKCATPGYPGYCCLDCASTAANIRAITNELKGKNA